MILQSFYTQAQRDPELEKDFASLKTLIDGGDVAADCVIPHIVNA